MKQKRFNLIIMILSFSMIGLLSQNTLNVHERLGTKTSFALNTIQKLVITGGNLTVINKNATTSTFSLTNLAQIDFLSISTGIVENQICNQFLVYPNPTQDVLNINLHGIFTSEIQKLDIFGIDGKIVISEIINKNKLYVSVTSLTKGIYFCRIYDGKNATITKFIKL